MKKLIHKYLSNYYQVKKASILSIDEDITHFWFMLGISRRILIKELNVVFGLTDKQLRVYIKSWVLKQDAIFDFSKWWDSYYPENSFGLIGTDLVPVQPMNPPNFELVHFDYSYEPDGELIGEFIPEQPRNERPYLTELREIINNMRLLGFPLTY